MIEAMRRGPSFRNAEGEDVAPCNITIKEEMCEMHKTHPVMRYISINFLPFSLKRPRVLEGTY